MAADDVSETEESALADKFLKLFDGPRSSFPEVGIDPPNVTMEGQIAVVVSAYSARRLLRSCWIAS